MKKAFSRPGKIMESEKIMEFQNASMHPKIQPSGKYRQDSTFALAL